LQSMPTNSPDTTIEWLKGFLLTEKGAGRSVVCPLSLTGHADRDIECVDRPALPAAQLFDFQAGDPCRHDLTGPAPPPAGAYRFRRWRKRVFLQLQHGAPRGTHVPAITRRGIFRQSQRKCVADPHV